MPFNCFTTITHSHYLKKMKIIRKFLKYFFIAIAILILGLSWIKIRSLPFESEKPLAVRWEGLVKDSNFRDVGSSINQCYGEEILRSGYLLRSNGWFSGWSCDDVGNPDVIFSLNYSPEAAENYFCWDEAQSKPNIGLFLNPEIKLDDLEFMETWEDDKMRAATCRFFDGVFNELINNNKTLVHCSAGRDRTGTFSAVLAALAAEQMGRLDDKMLEAIECDYRKTKSLIPDKFGRMERFIRNIRKNSSVATFISQQCNISLNTIKEAAESLKHNR